MSASDNPVPLQGDLTRDLESLADYSQDLDIRIDAINDKAIFDQVNVKDYGAVGDGITDDTDAIQSALDEAGHVVFDNATYIFTSLTLSSNTIIEGNGAILKSSGENTTSLYFTGKSNITIKNLEIYGSGVEVVSKTGYQYHGIYGYNSTKILIDNVKIHDMPSGGVLFVDSSVVTVKNCHFYNNLDMFDIAFGYGNTNNEISQFICTNNICESSNRYGIHVQGIGEDYLIDGNTITGKHEYGIMLYLLGNTTLRKARVINNYVEDISYNDEQSYYSGMGIYLQTVDQVICNNNIIIDVLKNRPDDPTDRTLLPGAISISNCGGATCIGNIINGSGKDGIGVTKTSNTLNYPVVISGNTIRNVAEDGIHGQELNNTVISNNSIVNGSTSGNVGILIKSTSSKTTDNVKVDGNIVEKFDNGIVVTKDTGTIVTNISVNNNMVRDIAGTFIQANTVTDVTINNNTCKALTLSATASTYVIQAVSVTNGLIVGNLCSGGATYKLARGIIVTNGTDIIVQSNNVIDLSDVYYSIYESGTNTKVFFYDNNTDRQTQPFRDGHNIGNAPETDTNTNIKIIYKTSIPVSDDGSFGVGSICFNLSPSAGGTIGWSCVSAGTPGTWKTFGAISA